MRVLIYAIQSALKNLWFEKWINFLTILTVGVGIFIIGIYLLITQNVQQVLKNWIKDFGIIIYLEDDINIEKKKNLVKKLEEDTDFHQLSYISSEKAIEILKKQIEKSDLTLDYIDTNPLPESIEVKFKDNKISHHKVKEKVLEIQTLSGIEDIQYGEKWLSTLSQFSKIISIIGAILGIVIITAIGFVTYSTIKIHLYRRYEELMTLKLLGATKIFMRMPFLIEGFFVGIFGGTIGFIALYGLYSYLIASIDLPLFKNTFMFLTPQFQPVLPLLGAMMSVIGTLIAIGKIRY